MSNLRIELSSIPTSNELLGWQMSNEIDDLGERYASLFIYASTSCEFIADPIDIQENAFLAC